MLFLDKRGLGEMDYEPVFDIEAFHEQFHVLIVVMKAMDHSQHAVMRLSDRFIKPNPIGRLLLCKRRCMRDTMTQPQNI